VYVVVCGLGGVAGAVWNVEIGMLWSVVRCGMLWCGGVWWVRCYKRDKCGKGRREKKKKCERREKC
jgi:hypothetical protein